MTIAKDSPDYIKYLLTMKDAAVERAIVAIYNRQTDDEQRSEDTKHLNGIGFTGADARLGSYYAKWILSGKHLNGNHLNKARLMSLKYVRQLCEIASSKVGNSKEPSKEESPKVEKPNINSDEELRKHREQHTKENSWWMNDAKGIPLCRVCDECEREARSKFKPEVLGESGNYEDEVEEPIEEDE